MIYRVMIDWWDGTRSEESFEWRWESSPEDIPCLEWLRFRETFINRLGCSEPYPMQIRVWETTGSNKLVLWANNEHIPDYPIVPTTEQQRKLDFYKALYASKDEELPEGKPVLAKS